MDMDTNQQQQQQQPQCWLLDAPGPFLLALVHEHLGDRDVAVFSCACTSTAALCDDPLLWRELLRRRYGPDVLPSPRPTEPCQPQVLDGWVFFQGVEDECEEDSSSSSDEEQQDGDGGDADVHASLPPAPPSLAELAAAAARAGCEGFTTHGALVRHVRGSRHLWARWSYAPHEGTYVREEAAQAAGLRPPQTAAANRRHQQQQQQSEEGQGAAAASAAAAAAPRRSPRLLAAQQQAAAGGAAARADDGVWPPEVPGWRYYPCCISRDHTAQVPEENFKRHASLEALLSASLARPDVVAVTPAGETKRRLQPQAAWRVQPLWSVGMYVKEREAANLTPPPGPVPDYRALAGKLGRLRLHMSDADVVWLDGRYLSLVPVDGAPGSPRPPLGNNGLILHLHGVCWLDISGRIPGVLPGSYEVVWCLKVPRQNSQQAFNLSAQATPVRQEDAGEGAGGGDGSSGGGGGLSVRLWQQQILELGGRDANGWQTFSVGVLQVPVLSTVQLRWWDHSDYCWKAGIEWSHAQLRPVRQEAGAASTSGAAAAAAAGVPSLAGGLQAAAHNCRVA